jgi:hypothetical protein
VLASWGLNSTSWFQLDQPSRLDAFEHSPRMVKDTNLEVTLVVKVIDKIIFFQISQVFY